ncbi:MAG: hypothetical protein ABJI69_09225 [Balneola sp.]
MKTIKLVLPLIMIFAASLPSFSASVDSTDHAPTIELAYVDAGIDQVKTDLAVDATGEYIGYEVEALVIPFVINDVVDLMELTHDLQAYTSYEDHYKPIIDLGFRWISKKDQFLTNSIVVVSNYTPAKRTGERLLLRA